MSNLSVHPLGLNRTKHERHGNDNKNGLTDEDMVTVRKHYRLAKAIWNGPVSGRRVNKIAKGLGVGYLYNGGLKQND